MVLVTGGTGFLGSYIISHLLERGYRVRALKRSSSRLPFYLPESIFEKVEWVEGDILDVVSLENVMQGADTVIHAAALVSFRPKDKESLLKINVEGTANLVNMALETNVSRFIHISSVAALGRSLNGETINEKKQWQDTNIHTHYAISKYKAEMEVWRAMGEGLNSVIVNPSTILGYGDWNNSSCSIFKTVYNEFPFYTSGINGFVYIEDVARATIALLESGISNERFIINGENWAFRKLFNEIANGFHKKQPSRNATPLMASIAWRAEKIKSLFTGRPSILSKETARLAQTQTYFDNSKIRAALPGFSFTPLEEAVRLSCEKYIQQLA